MKQTIFENTSFTTNLDANPTNTTETTVQRNIKEIHHSIVENHIQSLKPNKIINQPAPPINKDEQTLLRKTRRTLAQLRTNKSPFLKSYLHKIDPQNHPSPLCPLCNTQNHDTKHLFTCSSLPTHLTTTDLWNDPVAVAGLLALWNDAKGAAGGGPGTRLA